MTLTAALNEIKAGAKERIPAETLAIMTEATEELSASGLVEQAIGVGQDVPGFRLDTSDDKAFDIKAQLASGPLVLTFFRGSW